MSLATRCPDCKTLNPTTAAQLQAQNGHITCGHCGTLFSGIDHLTPADEDSWTHVGSGDSEAAAVTEPATVEAAGNTTAPAPQWSKLARRVLFWRTSERRRDGRNGGWPRFARRWAWGLGVLLVVQLIWWQRLGIAAALPFLSAPLAAWSAAVGTDLAGPASTRLKVMASSLKSSADNQLQLEVRILNTARTPSRWPLVELKLRNSKRETVTSITLRVADYAVSTPDTPARTLKPGDDAEIIAYIDTSVLNGQSLELPPTGFEVTLVDAPPKRH